MKRAALAIAAVLAGMGPVMAAEIKCEGVFGKDATLADFETAYGKANVSTGVVPGPEGTTMIATSVFSNDPDKAFTVYWWDEEKHERLANVTVPPADTAPGGVKIGMPIAEVQALNGEPFTLTGFDWDYGGAAGFQSGKLANLPGGCFLSLTFSPSKPAPDQAVSDAISGDKELTSDMRELVPVAPIVSEISLGYPDGQAEDEGE
jgi:hypothetical protein